MKKIFAIFLICFFTSNAFAKYGSGDIKLSDKVVRDITYYIDHPKGKPYVFLVTEDGQNSAFWYCAHSACVPSGSMDEKRLCERRYGKKCHVFMIRRSIKWKNEATIAARGKERSFSSKETYSEVKEKLKKLGFVD